MTLRSWGALAPIWVLLVCTPLNAADAPGLLGGLMAPTPLRVGAWNIEWLGQPGNRSGVARNRAQTSGDLARYIQESEVAILALEEICDDDQAGDRQTNTTLDAAIEELNADGDSDWNYLLFPKKIANDVSQHTGVMWDGRRVSIVGEPLRLPVDDSHQEFNLLDRAPHAVKFSLGSGLSDVVLIPLHLKSNRGGVARTRLQRKEEASRIASVLHTVTSQFADDDIVLLGDFNVLQSTEGAIETLTQAGFVDLNADDEPTTWQGDAPFDRIFVASNQPEFVGAPQEVFTLEELTPEDHKKRLSDHFMVVTTVSALTDDDGVEGSPPLAARSPAGNSGVQASLDAVETFPDYNSNQELTDGAETFQLSQSYPATYNVHATFPWEGIDYRIHPKSYAEAVLKYCLEGNVDPQVDFRVQRNAVRRWYHAPWLHEDGDPRGAGREYLHGLTRERRSRPRELHPQQTDYGQNWAVGFYNDRGGYTLGQVWHTPDGIPNPAAATFPAHTVAFKLLFTDAPDEQVPYLRASKEWSANIYENTSYELPRKVRTVRLLQIDIAVKDPRAASDSGWVFGTFIYDGSRSGRSPFDRVAYVGLSWHDDEGVASRLTQSPPSENPDLTGTILNHELLEPSEPSSDSARMYHTGLGGRLNGPVDNPISSCISCHGRAAVAAYDPCGQTPQGLLMPFFNSAVTTPADFNRATLDRFFRAIPAASHLEDDDGKIFVTVDYSQQLAAGIRNFYAVRALNDAGAAADDMPLPKASRGD